LSPHEGEALGLWYVMSWVLSSVLQNVICKSDSKMLVYVVHSISADIYEFHVIFSKIRGLLALHHNFEVKFIQRQTNMIAHTLVKVAISNASRRVYDYFLCKPDIILALVLRLITRASTNSLKIFNVVECPKMNSNPGIWLR